MPKTASQSITSPADIEPFRPWCRRNGIAISSGYRFAHDEENPLRLVKLNGRTYVRREDAERWLANLPAFKPKAA